MSSPFAPRSPEQRARDALKFVKVVLVDGHLTDISISMILVEMKRKGLVLSNGGSRERGIKVNHWTDEEDGKLRAALADGCSFRQASERIGRPLQATTMRAYRLGLKSGWQRAAPAE